MLKKALLLPKAFRQLGAPTMWRYAKYQLLLRSGWLQWQTPAGRQHEHHAHLRQIVKPAKREEIKALLGEHIKKIFVEADEILSGKVRLFGTDPVPLELSLPFKLEHWTRYHSNLPDGSDIKPTWEAGRFGWATVLARAYYLSEDDRYAEGFWRYFETFVEANPTNLGPHWSSAQEVGLRIIAWAYCYSLLAEAASTTPERKAKLITAVAEHANRIPPTVDYALAQNNNHVLSEGLGLYTASALLHAHPQSNAWRKLGRHLFLEGVASQLFTDGSYVQESANYHRMMLLLCLWAHCLTDDAPKNDLIPEQTSLLTAVPWLVARMDEHTGQVTNFGHNDGGYFLPLSVLPFADYRPVVQAANLRFSNKSALPPGLWDEMMLWLGVKPVSERVVAQPRLTGRDSWGNLRTGSFHHRPAHADQLHFDLWWRGHNLVRDAGTYLYNAPPPWDNGLARTRVHNAVVVDNREVMTRAGRFLWLDWVNAEPMPSEAASATARLSSSTGSTYKDLGLTYQRRVSSQANRWVVKDYLTLQEASSTQHSLQINWLLPDWPWKLTPPALHLESPRGKVEIGVHAEPAQVANIRIIRAGELIHGDGPSDPIMGWFSPTYGVKVPSLSFIIDLKTALPATITTTFTLP